MRGAEWSRFEESSLLAFARESFSVTSDSDRMGVRLDGTPMVRRDGSAELVSEVVAPGAIQVPPEGRPILLLADCQTIGGYPKLAHLITVDMPIAAQIRPGDQIWFREVSIFEAHRLFVERDKDLRAFRTGLELHSRATN
jgi:antagonist of KipI